MQTYTSLMRTGVPHKIFKTKLGYTRV